jgi:hypothetical protein
MAMAPAKLQRPRPSPNSSSTFVHSGGEASDLASPFACVFGRGGDAMKIQSVLIVLLAVVCALPLSANDNKKNNKDLQRGMLEKMEAVPCGAKQRGLSGLGTLWASAGITHVNSDEKLCPQYLLRTDQMDYQIRPMDLKHATILPVGTEGEFRIKQKELILTMPEGGDRKTRSYEVVAMSPANPSGSSPSDSAEHPQSSDNRSSSDEH